MNTLKSNFVFGICVAVLVTGTGGAAEGKERAKKGKQGAADAPAQDHAAAASAKAEKHREEVAARAAAHQAKAEEHQKASAARKAAAHEKKAAAQAGATKARGEAQAKRAKNHDLRTEQSNEVTENRRNRQEQRIEQGIKKGYLTPNEVAKLNTQQKEIERMRLQFNGDGKITHDEAKRLRSSLNDASLDIWTEKHDIEGKQMPVYRLGKDIRLNPEVAARLESDSLSKAEARKFLGDFHSLVETKKKLNGPLADSERSRLQAQYDQMLGLYFSAEPPAARGQAPGRSRR